MKVEEDYKSLGTVFTIAGFLAFVGGILGGCQRKTMLIADILIFLGVYLVLGYEKFVSFVTNKKRFTGSAVTLFSFFLILIGNNVIGSLFQLLGIYSMFGGFVPSLLKRLRESPYVGSYIETYVPVWVFQYGDEEKLPV